jgi:ABC-2 type transport system permease protein
MKKILLIIRQELINTFSRPSFLIVAVGIPLISALIFGGIKLIQSRAGEEDPTSSPETEELEMDTEGYVDQSGLIQIIPPEFPEGQLLAYQNEDQAKQALASGDISAYYIIPADYVDTGEIFYVFPDNRPLIDDGQKWVMQWTLMVNLLGGDVEAADRIWNMVWKLDERNITPLPTGETALEGDACSRPGSACQSNDLIRYIPSIMAALFYISFMLSSTMLFSSITTEKENRTLEVLLVSISPRQMMIGKTIGLGIAGIIQTVIWLGTIYTIFNLGGSTLNLPENFSFPPEIIFWSLVFFLGGFGVYASLMAGAGALVPKMKEAGSANFVVLSPLLIAYMVGIMAPLAESAEALLPVVLSFFPLTAPILMVMRLTNGFVPLWQLLLSAVLVLATNVLIVRATAKMFKAQNLLSGQPFSLKRYYQILFSRG